MTTISIPNGQVDALIRASAEAGLRAPSSVTHPTSLATADIGYTPDLTAAELATLTTIRQLVIGATIITPAERTALESSLTTLRPFQQMSQSDFIALTQNQRDRQMFDVTTALIRVIRAVLRDG